MNTPQTAEEIEQYKAWLVKLKIRAKLKEELLAHIRCAHIHLPGLAFEVVTNNKPIFSSKSGIREYWSAHVIRYTIADSSDIYEAKNALQDPIYASLAHATEEEALSQLIVRWSELPIQPRKAKEDNARSTKSKKRPRINYVETEGQD